MLSNLSILPRWQTGGPFCQKFSMLRQIDRNNVLLSSSLVQRINLLFYWTKLVRWHSPNSIRIYVGKIVILSTYSEVEHSQRQVALGFLLDEVKQISIKLIFTEFTILCCINKGIFLFVAQCRPFSYAVPPNFLKLDSLSSVGV